MEPAAWGSRHRGNRWQNWWRKIGHTSPTPDLTSQDRRMNFSSRWAAAVMVEWAPNKLHRIAQYCKCCSRRCRRMRRRCGVVLSEYPFACVLPGSSIAARPVANSAVLCRGSPSRDVTHSLASLAPAQPPPASPLPDCPPSVSFTRIADASEEQWNATSVAAVNVRAVALCSDGKDASSNAQIA